MKYKLTKQKWDGIIGAQYQHNKNWMFRTEAGIVGTKIDFVVS